MLGLSLKYCRLLWDSVVIRSKQSNRKDATFSGVPHAKLHNADVAKPGRVQIEHKV